MEKPKLMRFAAGGVPDTLKVHKRFVLWKAEWVEAKQKYTKIPKFLQPPYNNCHTTKPEHWTTYDKAVDAYHRAVPNAITGLGYCMLGPHNVVGIDLDNCVDVGFVPNAFALDIVQRLNSYTEFSPSGKGLRIFLNGDVPEGDWTNHDVGIECYTGSEARFLTITGQHLQGTPTDLQDVAESVLDELRAEFAKAPKAAVLDKPVPNILFEPTDWRSLDLPQKAVDFLSDGTTSGDGSAALNRTAHILLNEGLVEDDVFSILVGNEHAMAVAERHRSNPERALAYIWQHHVLQPSAKVAASSAEFEALAHDQQEQPATNKIAEVTPKGLFHLKPLAQFLQRTPPKWIIKKVLPLAGLGVLFGESGSGKSFIALDMAMAVAQGSVWRGHKVTRQRVVYVAAEGVGGFRNRVDAYIQHHRLDPDEFFEWFRVIERAPNLMDKKESIELASALVAWGQVGVVIVDTLAQSTPGANENAGEDMGKALGHCKGIHTATKAMVLLIHHSGKDASKGARGWSGLKAAADVELEVTNGGITRCLAITKQKDGESGQEYGFALLKVPLGVDEDGEVYDSCITVEAAVTKTTKTIASDKSGGPYALILKAVFDDFSKVQTEGIETKAVLEEALRRAPVGDKSEATRRDGIRRALRKLIQNEVLVEVDSCLELGDLD